MFTANAQTGERGSYFAKKNISLKKLPEYKEIKNQLPYTHT